MNRREFESLFAETLRSERPSVAQLDRIAAALVEVVKSKDPAFLGHIRNRLGNIATSSGKTYDPEAVDLETARELIAYEIGYANWQDLTAAADNPPADAKALLFKYATAAMERGDFSALEAMIGRKEFDGQIKAWFEKRYFDNEPETLTEIFSAACWLGHVATAEFLLDKDVDPLAGMGTGLNGFHWAASHGQVEIIKLLIERGISMEVKNMYGGTVFEQAIWSAVNEYTPQHGEIVERLARAGAVVDDGYREWWNKQKVPDGETKRRIANILREHEEFHARVYAARKGLSDAESGGTKQVIADALKELGSILRRPPFMRGAANAAYERAADLYMEVGQPLEAAWVKRHIGINHEYAERLQEAEQYYDESLSLFREHAADDDPNYANTVRYPAVIKERLGKSDEAALLWEEAHDRYAAIGPSGLGEGVAEAAAWLTIFAIEADNRDLAYKWLSRASQASSRSQDPDTHKFIADVERRFEEKFNG